MELKMFGQTDSELPKQEFLLWRGFGDPPQPDLATVGGGQNDVGALQSRKQGDCSHGRHGLGVIDTTQRWRRGNCGSPISRDATFGASETIFVMHMNGLIWTQSGRP
jgi:hypothetical protein